MPDDETIIEAMARSMCMDHCLYSHLHKKDGIDVDSYVDQHWRECVYSARMHLAAHRAMIKAEKEIGE